MMTTAIRAHRILAALANYQSAEIAGSEIFEPHVPHLGAPVGCYRNPGVAGELVAVFADGLSWTEAEGAIGVRFAEIVDVSLPEGKESEALSLWLSGDRELRLPIRGGLGRCHDSLEVLRFLDRVCEDGRRRAAAEAAR